jgi:hypothetical protein
MNRSIKALALAAFALAAALGATSAQASANNFTVNLKFKNADPVLSMKRTSGLPATLSGMSSPAATILAGNFEPGSGTAIYSDTLPAPNASAHIDVTFAQSTDGISNPCTFTITVIHDNNLQPYQVQFSNNGVARCVVPASARSSNGTFAGTFELDWST